MVRPVRLRGRLKPAKYRAKPTERDGIRFDSQAEAKYYDKLKLAKESGDLLLFLRQVPFDLPGATKYRVDFEEIWANGDIRFVDVKSPATEKLETFRLKKRQVAALYGVEIEIER